MDIIKYLSRSVNLGSKGKLRLEEMGLVNPLGNTLVSVPKDTKASRAFSIMFEEKLTGLPILDEKGILIATITVTDLKGISNENIGNINLPVLEFLQKTNGAKAAVPITCRWTDNLEDILPKMTLAKIHRVWITNAAQQPIGVVSLTDAIHV